MNIGRTVRALGAACIAFSATVVPTNMIHPAQAQVAVSTKQPLRILVLGDSYSAGNGAGAPTGNYYPPSPCMRSHDNWAEQYAQTLDESGFAVTLVNHACSDAVSADMWRPRKLGTVHAFLSSPAPITSQAELKKYVLAHGACKPQAPDDDYYAIDRVSWDNILRQVDYTCTRYLKAQIDFVNETYDLVLFTMGGNDVHFSEIVKQCFVAVLHDPGDCRRNVESARKTLDSYVRPSVTSILKMIGQKLRPSAKIVYVAYPYLERDPNFTLVSVTGSDTYRAGAAVRRLGDDGDAMQRAVVDQYNRTTPEEDGPRAIFVDKTKAAFAGHEPHGDDNDHGTDRWIFSYADTTTVREWYHPTPRGHQAWAAMMATYGAFGVVPSVVEGRQSNIDLAIVVDNTGSMSNTIDAVKVNIGDILDELASKATNYRISIVTYRDQPPEGDYVSRVEQPFTDDLPLLRAAVNRMSADGGGDDPEAVYSGIMSALDESWRSGVKKVVIVIGDAPPKDPEPISGFTAETVQVKADAIDPAAIAVIDVGAAELSSAITPIVRHTGGRRIGTSQSAVVGAIDQIIATIANRPSAWLAGPHVVKVGTSLDLDAGGSYAIGGSLTKFDWDFDGDQLYDESTTEPRVSHEFDDLGSHLVTVRVTDDNGLSGVANTTVDVTPDGDSVPDAIDNCPADSNPDQRDGDRNHIGDVCDTTPLYPTAPKPPVTTGNAVAPITANGGGDDWLTPQKAVIAASTLAFAFAFTLALTLSGRSRRRRRGARGRTVASPVSSPGTGLLPRHGAWWIESGEVADPPPGEGGDPANVRGAFCTGCGAALPAAARFCGTCGKPAD
jgi:hypothetical protein